MKLIQVITALNEMVMANLKVRLTSYGFSYNKFPPNLIFRNIFENHNRPAVKVSL